MAHEHCFSPILVWIYILQVTSCLSEGARSALKQCNNERNQPCVLAALVELVAGCMRRKPQEIAEITYSNSLRVFKLQDNNLNAE